MSKEERQTTYKWWDDPFAKEWLSELRTKSNRYHCRSRFSKFFSWLRDNAEDLEISPEITPKEMIELRVRQWNSDSPRERKFWETTFKKYMKHLETVVSERTGKRLSSNTIHNRVAGAMSFFSHHAVPVKFDFETITPRDDEMVTSTKWIPVNEEIRALHNAIESHRDKAVLLVLYQSGFSPIDTCNLKIEDFQPRGIIYDETLPYLYIERLRQKVRRKRIPQQTCISNEALFHIRYHLRDRDNPEEGWLFESEHGNQLEPRFVRQNLKKYADKIFGKEMGFQVKNLRDAYENGLRQAGLSEKTVNLMMGHKPTGSKANYRLVKPTITAAYERAFQYLTINGASLKRAEVEELGKRVNYLQSELEERDCKQREVKIKLITEYGWSQEDVKNLAFWLAKDADVNAAAREMHEQITLMKKMKELVARNNL